MWLVYLIYWMLLQLVSYGAWWVVFVAVALGAARLLRGPGMVLGHVLLAMMIVGLDVRWVQGEMRKPGWSGVPDQDFVFMIGMGVRVVLVNTVLLPVSGVGLQWARWRAGEMEVS